MSHEYLLKAAEFFIDLMTVQVVYTFDFFLVALESALLSGEEMNSKFSPSALCLLFLFFHSDPSGQWWSTYLSMNICQGPVESMSCVCVWVLVWSTINVSQAKKKTSKADLTKKYPLKWLIHSQDLQPFKYTSCQQQDGLDVHIWLADLNLWHWVILETYPHLEALFCPSASKAKYNYMVVWTKILTIFFSFLHC